jgi:hypothetical protein
MQMTGSRMAVSNDTASALGDVVIQMMKVDES